MQRPVSLFLRKTMLQLLTFYFKEHDYWPAPFSRFKSLYIYMGVNPVRVPDYFSFTFSKPTPCSRMRLKYKYFA
jgi:hypothetical protein